MSTLYDRTDLYHFSTAQRVTCLRLVAGRLRADHAEAAAAEIALVDEALAAHAEARRVEAAWAARDQAHRLSPEALGLRKALLQRMTALRDRLDGTARVARSAGRVALALLAEELLQAAFPSGLSALHAAPTDALVAELSQVSAVLDQPRFAGEHGRLEIRLVVEGLDGEVAALEEALDARDAGPAITREAVQQAVSASEEAFARVYLALLLRWFGAPEAANPLRHVEQLQARQQARRQARSRAGKRPSKQDAEQQPEARSEAEEVLQIAPPAVALAEADRVEDAHGDSALDDGTAEEGCEDERVAAR